MGCDRRWAAAEFRVGQFQTPGPNGLTGTLRRLYLGVARKENDGGEIVLSLSDYFLRPRFSVLCQ